ncbi:effector-associated constant component EACC1 [Plantactinospora sp. DSM 117369]
MDLRVCLTGSDDDKLAGLDALRDLQLELVDDPAFRGRVILVERPADPGTLGPVLEGLRILLEPQTLTPLLAALVTYLRIRSRDRTSDLELTVRRTDDSTEIKLSGQRIRQLDAVALAAELERHAERLDGGAQRLEGGAERPDGTDAPAT